MKKLLWRRWDADYAKDHSDLIFEIISLTFEMLFLKEFSNSVRRRLSC